MSGTEIFGAVTSLLFVLWFCGGLDILQEWVEAYGKRNAAPPAGETCDVCGAPRRGRAKFCQGCGGRVAKGAGGRPTTRPRRK